MRVEDIKTANRQDTLFLVGRTPWSAADALVGSVYRKCPKKAGRGAGCGPGGPPHQDGIGRIGSCCNG